MQKMGDLIIIRYQKIPCHSPKRREIAFLTECSANAAARNDEVEMSLSRGWE